MTIKELKEIITENLNSMFNAERRGQTKTFKEIVDYSLFCRGFLNEMSLHKKDFVGLLLDFKDQIVENWCLCAYCSLYDKENLNFKHWCVEFCSYVNKIKRCDLKSGDKKKVIYNTYVEKFDLNSPNMVYRIIRSKFYKEQIDNELAKSISEFFSQQCSNLIKFLGNDDYDAEEYVIRTFDVIS